MSQNPYTINPAVGESFLGRDKILEWVEEELRFTNNRIIVLSGQRRIGKTSLLMQLRTILPTNIFFPVYFDLQGRARETLGKVLTEIAQSIVSELRLRLPVGSMDDEGSSFSDRFLPLIYGKLNERRLVFLLDEFDVLDVPEEEIPEKAAARTLLEFITRLAAKDSRLAFVLAIGRGVENLSIGFANFLKDAVVENVWVLDEKSAEELIRLAEKNNTLCFEESAVKRILALTNCHPFLIQLLCQSIWDQLHAGSSSVSSPLVVSQEVVESVVPVALARGAGSLDWMWRGLQPAEKIFVAAIAEVADEGRVVPKDQVIELLAKTAKRLRSQEVELACQELVQKQVLERAEGGFRFTIELFRRWVRREHPLESVKDELDHIRPEADKYFEIGFDKYKAGDYGQAIEEFRRALGVNPEHFRARLYLGNALLKIGRTKEALEHLEKAYEADESVSRYDFVSALEERAKELFQEGYLEEALEACKKGLAISSKDERLQGLMREICIRIGEREQRQGNLERAREAFEEAGEHKKVKGVRAQICERDRQWEEAACLYRDLVGESLSVEERRRWEERLQRCENELKIERFKSEYEDALRQKDKARAIRALAGIVALRPDHKFNGRSALQLLSRLLVPHQLYWIAWIAALAILLAVVSLVVFMMILNQDNDDINRPGEGETATIAASLTVESPTPAPTAWPPVLQPISVDNADQVTRLARLGRGTVRAALYSPDGALLALAGPVGVWLYNAKTLALQKHIATEVSVTSISFSPNSTILAIGMEDGTVQLHSLSSGAILWSFRGQFSPVKGLAFSPDGNILAVAPGDGTIQVWDVYRRVVLHTLKGHKNPVRSLAFSSDGRLLVSAAWDNLVYIWDVSNGNPLSIINSVYSIAFLPFNGILTTGSDDGTIKVWNVFSGDLLRVWNSGEERITHMALSPTGNVLVAASEDALYIWDIADIDRPKLVETIRVQGVQILAFKPEGNLLVTVSPGDTVRLWSLPEGVLFGTLYDHIGQVTDIAFSPSGNILAAGARDNLIRLWEAPDGTLLRILEGHSERITVVSFSPDGNILASGSADRTIRLWDVSDGTLLHILESHHSSISSLAFDLYGNRLHSSSEEGTAITWHLPDCVPLSTTYAQRGAQFLNFSPDSNLMALVADGTTVQLRTLSDNSLVHSLSNKSPVNDMAFSPDGKILAVGLEDGSINLWDVFSGNLIHTLKGHKSVITALAFSFNGDLVASGSNDGTFRLWQVSSGLCLCVTEQGSVVTSVAFSQDGTMAATGSDEGFIYLWGVLEHQ